MEFAMLLSILIVIISIIVILIVSFLSFKKIKSTISHANELNLTINKQVDFYKNQFEKINSQLIRLNTEVEGIQGEINNESKNFETFSMKQEELTTSLLYLKDHKDEYAKGISYNLKEEIKTDVPKLMKTFKKAFKKTFKKQKQRYQNEEKEGIR